MQPRSLGFLVQAQLVLLHLTPSLGLRTRTKNITQWPSVVVAGIGDSGTTAVIRALERVGLEHCNDHDYYDEPGWGHGNRARHIQAFLNVSKGEFSREAFQRDAVEWDETKRWLWTTATWDRECLELERRKKHLSNEGGATGDLKWGFKEPHYAWLLPVMDWAFRNETRYLLVARDPRDVCHNRMQDQFEWYGLRMNISDCYVWWATFWHRLLETYESEPRFAIVRIEDLVLPNPNASNASMETMGCVVRHIGMRTDWTSLQSAVSTMRMRVEAALTQLFVGRRSLASAVGLAEDRSHVSTDEADPQIALRSKVETAVRNFHNHSGAYMGHHDNFTENTRQLLMAEVANKTNPPIVHEMMRRLGYDPMAFRLLKPTTPACLCHRA